MPKVILAKNLFRILKKARSFVCIGAKNVSILKRNIFFRIIALQMFVNCAPGKIVCVKALSSVKGTAKTVRSKTV